MMMSSSSSSGTRGIAANSITVKTSDWKNECKSILVHNSERKQPISGNSRMRSILSVPKRKKTSTSPGVGSRKKLVWANSTYENNKPKNRGQAGIPRRLSLQEKVELYTNRPDLDLAGIMERLEAIKRLETMSMFNFGNSRQMQQVKQQQQQQQQQQDDEYMYEHEEKNDEEEQVEEEEEEEEDDEEDSDTEMKEAGLDSPDERVEDEFYDASSCSFLSSHNDLKRRAEGGHGGFQRQKLKPKQNHHSGAASLTRPRISSNRHYWLNNSN